MTTIPAKPGHSEILIYQTDDGKTRIEVRLDDETVWLSQKLMAELFQVSVPTVNEHIRNLYDEGELQPTATIRNFRIVQTEGSRQVSRDVDFYDIDVIISVGYRVKSHRGTQFRIWATQRLREYIIKGFTLDDERLKQAGGGNYFDELLARIRKLSNRELLDHAGTVSHEQAIEKASTEYEKYRSLHINDPSPVERHFLEAVKEVKRLEKESKLQTTGKTRKGKEK
jgi:hypothetical protein